jgi:competence protein ComEC
MPHAWRAPHWAALAQAWLAGLGLHQQCARLSGEAEFAALVLACLLLAALARRRPHWLLASAAVALLVFTRGAWRAQQRMDDALPLAWEGCDLRLTGRIASLPQAVEGQGVLPGWRFVFAVEQAEDQGRSARPGRGCRSGSR